MRLQFGGGVAWLCKVAVRAIDRPPWLPHCSFAIADVNYGGSTGYGRAFRKRLAGRWGIVDVDDCCHAAKYLAEQVGGLCSPKSTAAGWCPLGLIISWGWQGSPFNPRPWRTASFFLGSFRPCALSWQ